MHACRYIYMAVEPHNTIELINQIQQVTAQVVSSLSDRNSKHLCYLHQEHVCFWPENTRLALVPQWVELLFLFTGNLVSPNMGLSFSVYFFCIPMLEHCSRCLKNARIQTPCSHVQTDLPAPQRVTITCILFFCSTLGIPSNWRIL